MKKLFISCPMKYRTKEDIDKSFEKMKRYAEEYLEEKVEVIDTWIEEKEPEDSNKSVWYLGKSIEMLSQADVFIGMRDPYDYNGCYIEKLTAEQYGIPMIVIPNEVVFTKLERRKFEELNRDRYCCRPVMA